MLQIIFVLFLVFCTFVYVSVQKMPLYPLESSNKMPFFSNFCPHSLPIPSNVHTLRPGSHPARVPW